MKFNYQVDFEFCSRPLLSRSGCIFETIESIDEEFVESSRPLLSRSGCISKLSKDTSLRVNCSRPLLSRSGCIFKRC